MSQKVKVEGLSKRKVLQSQYGLLHYANLIHQSGLVIFLFYLLNLVMPILSYAVHLVLPCYIYDAILILT